MWRKIRFVLLVVVAVLAIPIDGSWADPYYVGVNTTDWCGYAGQTTGCTPMVKANFPQPWIAHDSSMAGTGGRMITFLAGDNGSINSHSYLSNLCYASHGNTTMVLTNQYWTTKQMDKCWSIAESVYMPPLATALKKANADLAGASFSSAMAACTKGSGNSFSLSFWLRYGTCLLKVGFVPKNIGSVIADTKATPGHPAVQGLRSLVTKRVPFAYVVVGADVMTSFVAAAAGCPINSGVIGCITSSGGGSPSACVTGTSSSGGIASGTINLPSVGGVVHTMTIKFPCTPPVGLKSMRTYMIAFIWLGTGIGLWGIASSAVKH